METSIRTNNIDPKFCPVSCNYHDNNYKEASYCGAYRYSGAWDKRKYDEVDDAYTPCT